MMRRLAACPLTLVLLTGLTAAQAQDSPLQFYSSDVAVIIRLKEPDRTLEAVADLVDQIQPGMGPQVQQSAGFLGPAISNPAKIGVDESRDWYAGVYLNQDEEPVVVFGIPAIDADDMVAALGDEMQTSVHGKWVLYTESDAIPKVTGDRHAGTLFSQMGKEVFDRGRLSLLVNAARVVETYRTQLEQAQEQAIEALNELRFAAPDVGFDLGQMLEIYGTMAEGLFQGIGDSSALIVAVTVDREGLGIEELVEFQDQSPTSRFLAKFPTSSMDLMRALPGDAVLYYGLHGGAKEATRWGMQLSAGMLQDEEDAAKLTQVLAGMDDVEFGSLVAALQIGDAASGLLKVSSIGEVSPGERFRDLTRDSLKAMRNIEFQGLKQETVLEMDVETYGDRTGDVVTMKQEFDEESDPFGMQAMMQNLLFGEAGIQTRNVFLDNKYLSTMGGGSQTMKDLLATLDADPGADLDAHRKHLLDKSNLLVLMDLPRMVAEGLQVAASMEELPIPIDEQMIRNLSLSPSYLGFAIGTEENAVRCKTHVPVEQMSGFAKLGLLFFALQAQQF